MSLTLKTLKVVSWNILARYPVTEYVYKNNPHLNVGKEEEERLNKLIQKFNEFFSAGVDIFLLQEVDKFFIDKFNLDKILKLKYNIYYEQDKKMKGKVEENKVFGNCIIVKNNIDVKSYSKPFLAWDNTENHYVSRLRNKFEKDNIFTLMNNSPTGNKYNNKNAVFLDIYFNNMKIRLCSFHLSGRKQTERITLYQDILQEVLGYKAILGGDCNSISDNLFLNNNKFNIISNDSNFTVCFFDYGNHKPASIDKIIEQSMSNVFTITEQIVKGIDCSEYKNRLEMIKDIGSDHFPIQATFQINKTTKGGGKRKKTKKKNKRKKKKKSKCYIKNKRINKIK